MKLTIFVYLTCDTVELLRAGFERCYAKKKDGHDKTFIKKESINFYFNIRLIHLIPVKSFTSMSPIRLFLVLRT